MKICKIYFFVFTVLISGNFILNMKFNEEKTNVLIENKFKKLNKQEKEKENENEKKPKSITSSLKSSSKKKERFFSKLVGEKFIYIGDEDGISNTTK